MLTVRLKVITSMSNGQELHSLHGLAINGEAEAPKRGRAPEENGDLLGDKLRH